MPTNQFLYHLQAVADNIYLNVIAGNNIPGNLTASLSDHVPQFFIALDIFSNPQSKKLNIFEKERFKFGQENFILDCAPVDWANSIKSDNRNVDQSFVNFLTKFKSILDMYALLKKISKQKTKI